MLEATRGPVVLDLGAVQHDAERADEDRWLHRHLAARFDRVVGVDMLEAAVEALNERGYELVADDVETMDLGIEADSVVAGELIEHVANPGLMLDRVAAHLKPGGRLVLTTPNPWYLHHVRRWLLGSMSINDEHVAWYGPIVLRQLLDRHGFDVVSVEPVQAWPHGPVGRVVKVLLPRMFMSSTWVCVAVRRP